MNRPIIAAAFTAFLAAQSYAAPLHPFGQFGEDNRVILSPEGRAEGVTLPDRFNDLGLAVIKNDVSQRMAANYMAYLKGHDPRLDRITPEDFNVGLIPKSESELEEYARAYFEEFYALVFAEGSELHDMAKAYLEYENPTAADLNKIMLKAKEHPMMQAVNDWGSVREYFFLSNQDIHLDEGQAARLDRNIKANLSAFNTQFSKLFVSIGLQGADDACEHHNSAIYSITRLYDAFRRDLGFDSNPNVGRYGLDCGL